MHCGSRHTPVRLREQHPGHKTRNKPHSTDTTMNEKQPTALTRGEEEIMQILWQLGNGVVNEIIARTEEPHPKYTTVATFLKILENKNGCAEGRIFNIGNPYEEYSIKALADILIESFMEYPEYAERARSVKIENVSSKDYYGEGYQDVSRRMPSVKRAEDELGWKPSTNLRRAIKLTLDYHLLGKDYELETGGAQQ